ncbi:hypothetical protein ACIRBX_11525 [Kitasatospora sp. NPDC096147]|uniref:hypothetical protein n=1 Tax=Kitasatospora sp. NPDC096147 TaxID=3364093 RepID=UPI00380C574E
MTADQHGTPADAAPDSTAPKTAPHTGAAAPDPGPGGSAEAAPPYLPRTELRRPTRWTAATGAATHLAFLAYLLVILLEPWRPGIRLLPVTLYCLGLFCLLLWLTAGYLAPKTDLPPETATAPAPPTLADLTAAREPMRAALRRRIPGYLAISLLGVAVVPALFLPFSGAHPEVSSRQAELVAAGAQWGEYVLLPPMQNGDRLPAYQPYQDYRFAPVEGTPGEPFEADQSRSLDGVEVDRRVRLLTAPGQAPLAAPALERATEPAPIERTAVLVWIGIVLLGTAIAATCCHFAASDWGDGPFEDLYAAGPQWHRIGITRETVTRDLPEEEIDRDVDGAPTTTEECLRLDLPGSSGQLLFKGTTTPPAGLAWLAIHPELRTGTGSPRAYHSALIVPDRHGSYWGTVRLPIPAAADAPAPQPRTVRVDPAPTSLDTELRLGLTIFALWPLGWTLYHLLSPTDGTLAAWPVIGQLVLIPFCLGLVLLILFLIGAGLFKLVTGLYGLGRRLLR